MGDLRRTVFIGIDLILSADVSHTSILGDAKTGLTCRDRTLPENIAAAVGLTNLGFSGSSTVRNFVGTWDRSVILIRRTLIRYAGITGDRVTYLTTR